MFWGRFVPGTLCSRGRFVAGTLCGGDALWWGRFVVGTDCGGDTLWRDASWGDGLWRGRYVEGRFVEAPLGQYFVLIGPFLAIWDVGYLGRRSSGTVSTNSIKEKDENVTHGCNRSYRWP